MDSELFYELRGKLVQVFQEFLAMDAHRRIFVFDIIAEFADHLQEDEDRHQLADQIMPTVALQLTSCKLQDGVFVPLFDCFTTLVKVAGVYGLKFVEPVFEFVLKLSRQITEALQVQVKKKSKERVKFEHELRNSQMRCFDFISTLIEASEGQAVRSPLAAQVPGLILSNLKTDDVFLRQMVYSLLGDFVGYCDPSWLAADIQQVVDALLIDCIVIPASMDAARTYLSIATNAVYALSEIIPKFAGQLQPAPILNRILKIYESPKVASAHQLHKFLAINCGVVFGRLGIFYPDETSKHLKGCLKQVCYGLLSITTEDQTKQDTFLGVNKSIVKNPQDFLEYISFYLEAVGLYKAPPPAVVEGIHCILGELLKGDAAVRASLEAAYAVLSDAAKKGLKHRFNFPPN